MCLVRCAHCRGVMRSSVHLRGMRFIRGVGAGRRKHETCVRSTRHGMYLSGCLYSSPHVQPTSAAVTQLLRGVASEWR